MIWIGHVLHMENDRIPKYSPWLETTSWKKKKRKTNNYMEENNKPKRQKYNMESSTVKSQDRMQWRKLAERPLQDGMT